MQHGRLISRSNDYCNSNYDCFRHDPPTLALLGRPRPAGQKTAGGTLSVTWGGGFGEWGTGEFSGHEPLRGSNSILHASSRWCPARTFGSAWSLMICSRAFCSDSRHALRSCSVVLPPLPRAPQCPIFVHSMSYREAVCNPASNLNLGSRLLRSSLKPWKDCPNRHYVDFGTTSVDPIARSVLPRFASR
jgi:hypothetical protein